MAGSEIIITIKCYLWGTWKVIQDGKCCGSSRESPSQMKWVASAENKGDTGKHPAPSFISKTHQAHYCILPRISGHSCQSNTPRCAERKKASKEGERSISATFRFFLFLIYIIIIISTGFLSTTI